MKKEFFNQMNEIAGLLMPRCKFNHFVSICRHDEKENVLYVHNKPHLQHHEREKTHGKDICRRQCISLHTGYLYFYDRALIFNTSTKEDLVSTTSIHVFKIISY